MTQYNNYEEMVIDNGVVRNLKMNGARRTRVSRDMDASLNFCVDLDGLPVEDLMKYFWVGFKIASASQFRKKTVAEAEALSGVCLNWAEWLGNKESASVKQELAAVKLQQIKNVEISARAFKDNGMTREQVKGIISTMGISEADVETILNAVFK